MGMRLGVVTIGQAPRTDLTPELEALLPGVGLVERGVLDGLDAGEIGAMAPTAGDHVLTTRLADGGSAIVGEAAVMRRLPDLLREVGGETDAVLLACTGPFPAVALDVPLFVPDRIIAHAMAAVAPTGRPVGIVAPLAAQRDDTIVKFARVLGDDVPIHVAVSSPYTGDEAGLRSAARELAEAGARVLALDCFGYTAAMRDVVADETGLPVVVARSVAARLAAEALGVGVPEHAP